MNAPLDFRRFIRPSFLPVLAACPAAARMSHAVVERFGEPPSPAVADLGTDMHAAVLLALLPLAERFIPHAPLNEPRLEYALQSFPGFSAWDRICVSRCVEFAVALIAKTRHDFPDEPVEVLLEQHLDGSVLGIDRGGSADLVIVVPFRHLRIVDWKCGFLDQGEAADHDQLAAYGVMGAATFKTKTVDVYLFQPRAEPESRASGAAFNGDELRSVETWTRVVVDGATDENPEALAGLHCAKCRALTRCQAAKELWVRYRDMYETIGQPSDADAWGNLVVAAKLAKAFADDAIEQAKGHAIAGGPIAGWRLQPGAMVRKIDSPQAVKLAIDAGVLHLLAEHVSVKASAVDAVPVILPAVTREPNAPSLKQVKASSAEAKA